jgi:alpha-mannosidase
VRDTVPADGIPVRSYSMDEVWHGMSLGKNAYGTQRASFEAERMIQSAEAIASVYGLFGRPYPRWNVYPFFTLEEAWRQLLMAQHHDNEECEWLCGDVAKAAHEQIVRLVEDGEFGLDHLVNRIDAPEGALVLFNPTGWDRTVWPYELGIAAEADENEVAVIDPVEVPAFGFAVVEEFEASVVPTPWQEQGKALKAALGEHQVELDPKRPGLSLKKGSIELGELFQLSGRSGDEDLRFTVRESKVDGLHVESEFNVLPSSESVARGSGLMAATVAPSGEALDVALRLDEVPDPDPGFGGAYCATLKLGDSWSRLFVDQPYSVVEIEGKSKGLKKYPSGDWMTSKQWFEEIENAFTSQTFVDLVDAEGNGYLIIHNGCQQWFREGQELKVVLSMKDPWEQGRYLGNGATRFRVVPHGPISNAERYRLAQQFLRHPLYLVKGSGEGATALDPPSPIQPEFSFGKVEPENVVVTALYRETEHDGKRWENYAGKGMGFPYVMRLVEFNGESAEVNLQVPGPVEKAAKTDLLGREIENLKAENNGDTATLRFEMRPHEIATLYLDIVPGRKQTRDLDAHRDKWATVHRVEDDENRAP